MLTKKFEKGITLLEALVAAAILGMIAIFFINSSSLFLREQRELIKQNKFDLAADLMIQDISEYQKSVFNPYGEVKTNVAVSSGTVITVEGMAHIPAAGDLFLVEGADSQFEVRTISETGATADDGIPIYEITVDKELNTPERVITIAENKKITFFSFTKNELQCLKDNGPVNLIPVEPPLVLNSLLLSDGETPCAQSLKDLLVAWQVKIIADPRISVATVEMSTQNLFKVTLGDGTNNTTLAKKFVECAYNVSPGQEVDRGGMYVEFDFGGKIGAIKTGVMSGEENPIKHFNFKGEEVQQWTGSEFPSPGESWNYGTHHGGELTAETSDFSCALGTVASSTCRQYYADLNTIAVFLYKYTTDHLKELAYDEAILADLTPEQAQVLYDAVPDVPTMVLQATGCSNVEVPPVFDGFNAAQTQYLPDDPNWNQCARRVPTLGDDGEILYPLQTENRVPVDRDEIKHNELSLWFIFSEANTQGTRLNGRGFVGFSTAHLPTNARVLVFDDTNESCYQSIMIEADGGKCDGGYDWGGKHDGLVLHLDKKYEDINDLNDVYLELTSPAWNIWQWKLLRSGTEIEQALTLGVPGCRLASNDTNSIFKELIAVPGSDVTIANPLLTPPEGHTVDSCWHTIMSPYSKLSHDLTDDASTMYIELPKTTTNEFCGNCNQNELENFFDPGGGFLRVGNELIGYETYDISDHADGRRVGRFSDLTRGLYNIAQVISVKSGDVADYPGDDWDGRVFETKINGGNINDGTGPRDSQVNQYQWQITVACLPMSDPAWSEFNADQKRKITSFNRGTGADADVTCQSGGEYESSPNLEIGRWWGQVINKRTPAASPVLQVEQRINLDFYVTRDHKYLVDNINDDPDNRVSGVDNDDNFFKLNDKIYNAKAVAAEHDAGAPVFDADPSYTMASIISYDDVGSFDPDIVNLKERDTYTRGQMADSEQNTITGRDDDFSDLTGPHITITVPKKVRIRSETADVTPTTRTVCE